MSFSNGIDELSLAALKRACRGTQERIYRRYATAAWTLAVRLCGCEAQAWDAVQAGFLRAFERAGQLRQPERFGPWLRRIIVNQVMDLNRQRFESVDSLAGEPEAMEPALSEAIDLERALAQLDVVDRTVLWLHDVEGLTHGEIAELAGHSMSWSKTRLSRARARIQRWLEAPDAASTPTVSLP